MSHMQGPTSPSGDRPDGSEPPSGGDGTERPGLANEPVAKTTMPLKVMLISIAVLLVTITVVAVLVTRTSGTPTPAGGPLSAAPTGAPVLPVQAGEYVRDPGTASAPPDLGVDRSILTSSAYYRRNGDNALIAVAARPVVDEKVLLDQIKVLAQRQVGDGWCGREEATGYDVCVVRRNGTAVFGIALRDQTTEEIVAAAQLILDGTQ